MGAVQFAGRESRFRDPVPGSLSELVADVVAATRELAERSNQAVVLLGQCSGALLCYLAATSGDLERDLVSGLVPVSRRAPAYVGRSLDPDQNQDALLAQAVELGGIPSSLLDTPGAMELVLPSLLADYRALSQWNGTRAAGARTLSVPVLTIRAIGDAHCTREEMARWGDYAPALQQHELPGEHFLLGSNPVGVAEVIQAGLSNLDARR